MFSQEYLKEILHYDPQTGMFTWKINKGPSVRSGNFAGCITKQGYIQIYIDQKPYRAHRLAWLYITGAWPTGTLDHLNGIRRDNRFENLRDATASGNSQNRRTPKKSTRSGYLGVHIERGKFRADITAKGKRYFLGRFDTAEEAFSAYLAAKREFHPFGTL